MEAALAVGVHRGTISRWCGAFRRNGASGIEKGKRGRRVGDQLILTEVEARRVQGWIANKCPDQTQSPFALWTVQAARELIHKKFGKSLGLSTMQLYLKRWGFSAQKPSTRATQRDPQKIAAWLEQDYPSIAARAKRDKAVIYWSDETGICNQDQIGKGYAPKGQTPILTQTGQKFSTSMIGRREQSRPHAVQALQGCAERRDLHRFHEASHQGREAKGLSDCRPAHPSCSRRFRIGWRATRSKSRSSISRPYAPEHNPDEYLNNDLKQTIKNNLRAEDPR